jgi:nitroreductase
MHRIDISMSHERRHMRFMKDWVQLTSSLSVIEAAESRRSIRAFSEETVPREDMLEILRVAGLAPSAHNLQPWRFVVVEDAALKEQLAHAANGQRQVRSAPSVIVMYSDMADALDRVEETVHPGMRARREEVARDIRARWAGREAAAREQFGAGQSYIALGFLLLAARSLGYGTSPMLGFDAARVRALLDLPEHVAIPALVAIGVPAEDGFAHHRHEVERIARFR